MPVINKIDLPAADPEKVIKDINEIIGIATENVTLISAKTGEGIEELMNQIVESIPPPSGNANDRLQALIIDSLCEQYVGVVSLVRSKYGELRKGDRITIMSTGHEYTVNSLGVFTPKSQERESLAAGEVGLLIA